ncbi:MAG: hypothetical protein LUC97_05820 [Clostridiales bacterium]|nr:hypothetical protein [Clostridiales bacterium]MCD8215141.1 hypothetical protein [Clostridiales bacterium]
MENYYKNSIEEIKKDLNKLEKKSGVKLIFVTVATVVLLTLIIIYLVLKFKDVVSDEYYDEYSEDDGADFPFDEEDEEDDNDEEYEEDDEEEI